jgi:hypothetical protein
MENYDWIRDPFNAELNGSILYITKEGLLIVLYSETSQKIKFLTVSHTELWIDVEAQYKAISEKAVKLLIPFAIFSLHETGFSTIALIKCKY